MADIRKGRMERRTEGEREVGREGKRRGEREGDAYWRGSTKSKSDGGSPAEIALLVLC